MPWLVSTWHDADSVCFRRLCSDGYHIVDRPRTRSQSESGTLLTNHGGVAIVSVPGVRTLAINLSVNPTSLELVCERVTAGSSSIIVLIYRPGKEAVTTSFFDDMSEIMDCVTTYSDPTYIVGDLNVRLERDDDNTELFSGYGYTVQLNEPTHVADSWMSLQHAATYLCRSSAYTTSVNRRSLTEVFVL